MKNVKSVFFTSLGGLKQRVSFSDNPGDQNVNTYNLLVSN